MECRSDGFPSYLTDDDIRVLRHYKNEPDEDNVRYKEIIKQKLLNNNRIIYLLNDEQLKNSDASNDEYFGVCILPYFLIAPVQHEVRHFICYETSFDDTIKYNSAMKVQEIIFHILVEQKDIIVKEIGVARHDLITAEIINTFQGCNDFGTQLKLISCKPSVTDTNYASYTLVFEQITPNSLTRADGKSYNLRR